MSLAVGGLSTANQGGLLPAIIAAVVVILMGGFNIWVTIRQSRATREETRRLTNRELWWQRFTWAAEGLFSDSTRQQRVSAAVLTTLASVELERPTWNRAVTSMSTKITNGTIAIARAQKRVLQMDGKQVPDHVEKLANLRLRSRHSSDAGTLQNLENDDSRLEEKLKVEAEGRNVQQEEGAIDLATSSESPTQGTDEAVERAPSRAHDARQ